MGGEETEVKADTTDVLLEAANFEPVGIMRSSERLALRTEGSNRWEKGVDPYTAEQAAVYASELIVDLAGARYVGETDAQGDLPVRPVTRLRPERTDAVAGLEIPVTDQLRILERLGFDIEEQAGVVTVPTWRTRDVTREVDVIEEVVRVHGLEEVPFTLPLRREMFGRLTVEQRLSRLCEETLAGVGFSEAYTFSLLADGPDELRLANPMTTTQAVLRTTLLDGLIEAAQRNVHAGNDDIALFEIAHVYLPSGGRCRTSAAASARSSRAASRGRRGARDALRDAPGRAPGRADARAVSAPGQGGSHRRRLFRRAPPGAARGLLGRVRARPGDAVRAAWSPSLYRDVIAYPPVRQDLAVVVAEEVPAGALVEAAREAAGDELREVAIFDVYRGEQVGDGRKSVALSLVFQSPERTLADSDAAEIRTRIVARWPSGSPPSCARAKTVRAAARILGRCAFSSPQLRSPLCSFSPRAPGPRERRSSVRSAPASRSRSRTRPAHP